MELHNPYGIYSDLEKASILSWKRKARFIEGYNIDSHLTEIIKQFFGYSGLLETTGLTYQFIELKKYIIENNYIGLIRYGADKSNNVYNEHITRYTQKNLNLIDLTIGSICSNLLNEYFEALISKGSVDSENQVGVEYMEELYRNTPNIDIYLNLEFDI